MRKLLAWLGVATLFMMTSSAHAQNDVLKPYVVLILDTSGSMNISTGSGPSSCGDSDLRINHAICAINNIVNSYGDMVFALGRFRESTSGTVSTSCDANNNSEGNEGHTLPTGSGGDQCSTQGPYCGECSPSSGIGTPCTTNSNCARNVCLGIAAETGTQCANNSDDDFDGRINDGCAAVGAAETGGNCNDNDDDDADGRINDGCSANGQCLGGCSNSDVSFELLTGLVDGNNTLAAEYTDGSCNTCSTSSTGTLDPEIWGVSQHTFTPLSGSMVGAKRYWEGQQHSDGSVLWQSNAAGFDPINRDPSSNVFLPTGCDPSASCTTNCCTTQCRPYITILLTDGDETCTNFDNTLDSAGAFLSTTPRNDGVNISTLVRSANVVTATTSTAHPFAVGDTVVVSGVTTNTSFNGTFVVTGVPSTTQVQWSQTGSNSAIGSGGTVRHVASDNSYRIELKPIGFGIAPGDSDIEAMAHAGGAPDLPGVNEGYYAQDEADIQLAISQILADSVRSESCNALDDDCDTEVDEDFPNKGGSCNNGETGICFETGTLVCSADGTGLECTAPPGTPGSEGTVCNQMDDDCDGLIDEGLSCTSCVPVGEICNNKDDDCDMKVDEGLTRACGQGTCTGVETCTNGTWGGCTADTPGTEICNGLDDDCDGVCDGLQVECSDVVTPGGPGTDNPGHPSNNPIPENICRPGAKTCAAQCDPNGNSFGICSGEVKPCNGLTPCTDPCNGLDDDCDNKIDEDFTPEDCSTNCGVGTTQCVNGNLTCNSTPATDDTTCNNVDDDCDNKIDEDWICADPINGMCPCGSGMVCDGLEKCVNGQVVCQGSPLGVETCNCADEDCDNAVDEGTVCPAGSTCTNCQCAFPCAQSEFPCPLGKKCDAGYCVNDPCYGEVCPPVNGNAQTCVPNPSFPNEPQCVDTCSVTMCGANQVCLPSTGECKADDCTTFPERCAENQVCIVGSSGLGQCVSNPCEGVMCPADQYCLGGACVPSCADVTCPAGQRCRQGMCETDPCGEPCPFGYACNDVSGECIEDPCKVRDCPQGQWCNPNDGQCEDDPCVANEIVCPNEGEVCRGGTCVDEADLRPDAAGAAHVTVGGGGGCSTTGGTSGLFVIGLALLFTRRRRRVSAARSGGGAQ